MHRLYRIACTTCMHVSRHNDMRLNVLHILTDTDPTVCLGSVRLTPPFVFRPLTDTYNAAYVL
jgi:hypothetical protein